MVRSSLAPPLVTSTNVPSASKPLMSLLFGRLALDFVTFAVIVASAKTGDARAQAELPIFAAGFRHDAALNSSYLAFIGANRMIIPFQGSFRS
jgi:ATP-binding cassette, subfamily B (MDR/TAP), member 1